jgi:hypothetical protein
MFFIKYILFTFTNAYNCKAFEQIVKCKKAWERHTIKKIKKSIVIWNFFLFFLFNISCSLIKVVYIYSDLQWNTRK